MALNLHTKYAQMLHDGEERIEFGKGYLLHPQEHRCSLTFATRTALVNDGRLMHEQPCITVDLHIIQGEGIGEGSAEELRKAAQEGRISADPQEFVAALEKGRILYLRPVQGILLLNKKDGLAEQPVNEHLFFASTQREEAITEIAEHVKRHTHRTFSTHNLQEKDILAIAAFISLQLP